VSVEDKSKHITVQHS